jgi:molecular chaperone GrpE
MTGKKAEKQSQQEPDDFIEPEVEYISNGSVPVDPDPVEKMEDFSSETKAQPEVQLTEEEKLQARVAELEDKLLRSAAEFENYRKRLIKQQEESIKSANDRFLQELLEVVDNFERAREHVKEDVSLDSLLKGIEMIHNQMAGFLSKYDISPIEAIGQPFDPHLHEAMLQVESDKYSEGIIALEIAKGYRQGNRVIRYSKVGVSNGKSGGKDSGKNK